MKKFAGFAAALIVLASQDVSAASGEMGTGVPQFGSYSMATGTVIRVWSLGQQTRPMPAGCTSLILTPETMGLDAYKIAVALLTTARVSGLSVRFFAHAERDGGCGADYVELGG